MRKFNLPDRLPRSARNAGDAAVVTTSVPISVVLVDDHPIVLQGLQQLFERQPDITVAASCSDAEGALQAVRLHRPDVLVLDLRMPGGSGLDLLRDLKAEKLDCRCV